MTDLTYDRTGGVTDAWSQITIDDSELSLPSGYNKPVVLASMQTFNGGDTAQLRIRDLHHDSFDVKVEEETSRDNETQHVQETVGHVAFPPSWLYNSNDKAIGYAGFVDASQRGAKSWIPVPVPTIFNPYNSAVFMQILSYNGSDPVHIRIAEQNPDTGDKGFFFKLEEWPSYDKWHTTERMGVVVLSKGLHALGGGRNLMVGEISNVKTGWKNVTLGSTTGGGRPVVISQCQTFNGGHAVVTRQREIGGSQVQLRLQEAESQGAHPNAEKVAYLAVGSS